MVLLKVAPLQIVMKNALILLATAYLFQGISVWADTMKKRNFSPGIKLLSYFVCILFFHFVAVILVAVGIIDIWINFRKVKVGAA
jgi:hypothetical protein